jgi:hypothetical protein
MQCVRAILSSVACPDMQYFFQHYLINGTIFEENGRKMHVSGFTVLSETFFILSRTERDIIGNVYRSSCKVPVKILLLKSNKCTLLVTSTLNKIRFTIKSYNKNSNMFRSTQEPSSGSRPVLG